MQKLVELPVMNSIFPCSDSSCIAYVCLTRLMEAYFFYHFTLFLMSFFIQNDNESNLLIHFHDYEWGFKFCYINVLITIIFVLPLWFHRVFYWISIIGAILFILYSLISFLNFAAVLNIKLVNKVDPGRRFDPYVVLLISISFLSFSFSLGVSLFILIRFSHSATSAGTCASKFWNILFTLFNLLLSVIGTVASLLPIVREYKPTSGIFQSSIVSAYTAYLLLNAILSLPCSEKNGCWIVTDCQENSALISNYDFTSFLGIFFTIAVIAYQTYRNSTEISETSFIDDKLPDETDSLTGEVHGRYCFWKFHVTFCIASLFMLQNMVDWSIFKTNPARVEIGHYAFFFKIGVSVLCHLLYIWTLLAPALFPNRNFSKI
ncbi:membrane protein PB1A10.07C, putative [Entamoeba dispar SAW760]|uniref:Membrane protein PB1A10.07C, putative n=1 Tax=Entamoeba dispar (strain ATCC PRA-260 / SAW760) TaxID=370354 RepID=B0E5L8_ENTDS|nr:membrane protein PB1A10.07C, putative [Entamoeba dispar SAW760]EDR30187.1 membrane protein PB1A10.07C, putative [Entamoeba dispar SAW760]|eukprot:EDR30187.1 membrane protein PB1A10.07C, putative [Entamoeba dispar SAW760]